MAAAHAIFNYTINMKNYLAVKQGKPATINIIFPYI